MAAAVVSDKEEAASRGNGEEKDNGGEGIEKKVACAEKWMEAPVQQVYQWDKRCHLYFFGDLDDADLVSFPPVG